jgi:hypothetical protein
LMQRWHAISKNGDKTPALAKSHAAKALLSCKQGYPNVQIVVGVKLAGGRSQLSTWGERLRYS